jgi:hypothetical protein
MLPRCHPGLSLPTTASHCVKAVGFLDSSQSRRALVGG